MGNADICWYQCQLELNELESGVVFDNCRCSPTATLASPTAELPTLPPECFSPSGLECSWYRNCLEQRYPCQGTEDGYAIEFAEKYCNLYSRNFDDFTTDGRRWVDGVRTCLQLFLVPFLRDFRQTTCAQLRSEAFRSHPDCYVNPTSGPGICELPWEDVWKSLWLVNFEGGIRDGALFTAPAETTSQMVGVIKGCLGTSGFIGRATAGSAAAVTILIPQLRLLSPAILIAQYVAEKLELNENGIGWLPLFDESPSTDTPQRLRRDIAARQTEDVGQLTLLLVELSSLDVAPGSFPTSDRQQSISETLMDLEMAVTSGALSNIPVMVDNEMVSFRVAELGQCGEIFCSEGTNITMLATGPPASEGTKVTASLYLYSSMLFFVLVCWV